MVGRCVNGSRLGNENVYEEANIGLLTNIAKNRILSSLTKLNIYFSISLDLSSALKFVKRHQSNLAIPVACLPFLHDLGPV